jgi:lysophospholipase L1-like esterase
MLVCAMTVAAGCGHSPIMPDPSPPVIACAPSFTVRGVSQTVSFPAPTATGGTLPVAISCTPASGSLFEPGTTSVTCTAADATARQSRCALDVTVTPFVLSITRLIAFGDSLTEGENGRKVIRRQGFLDLPNAYPTKLESLLNAEYPGQSIVVLNRGKSGESIEDGLHKRLPVVLSQDHGDALLLLDGYNNLFSQCRPRDAASQGCAREIDFVVATMRECIHLARTPAYGIKYIFVSTLTPPAPAVSGPDDRRVAPDAIVQANARLVQAVRAEGAILVDPYPLFTGHEAEYVDNDGLHLRPAGYQVLAESFFSAIKASVAASIGSVWSY